MFGILDLTWKPSAASTSPPAGKAPAVVRNDPYVHGIVIPGAWATLGAEEFDAQVRAARLTGATAGTALADFAVVNERGVYNDAVDPPTFTETVDGPDLRIVISLTATQTTSLATAWFWDMQQVAGSTLLAGKGKTLDDVTRVA